MIYMNFKKCLPKIPFLNNSNPSKYADCRKTVTHGKGLLMRMVQQDQVIIITCNGWEKDADEDGPGGVDVDDDQIPFVPPTKVPLSLILVV